jgi:hypothetical protein
MPVAKRAAVPAPIAVTVKLIIIKAFFKCRLFYFKNLLCLTHEDDSCLKDG